MIKILYPEIESAGGLIFALDNAFKRNGSSLRGSNNENSIFFNKFYARIEKDNKYSQIYIAAEEKFYLPDFWRNGVCLAHGKIDDIDLLVQSLDFWLWSDVTTEELSSKFSFVVPNKDAAIYDEGNEVEYKWKSILFDPDRSELHEFIELAIQNLTLSKLFPYTSLMTLGFSRCTGYPYTYDTPTVTPSIESGQFIVRGTNGDQIGCGNARAALKFILENLPKDIEPARKGTAED
jgi:hypothetical protein